MTGCSGSFGGTQLLSDTIKHGPSAGQPAGIQCAKVSTGRILGAVPRSPPLHESSFPSPIRHCVVC